jgi:hypothetical protein
MQSAQGSFPPTRVFWLFLFQALSPDGSCREALRKFQAWLAAEQGKIVSLSTAAYCKARARLPLKDIEKVGRHVARKIIECETNDDLWRGRPVKVIDGSSVSMPDTPENQETWPQPDGSKKGCGFPVMRIVAIFSLASGALISLAKDALSVHERTLFRKLWPLLKPGDVALADRGFCSFADFFMLAKRGVDSVMRRHPRRTVGVTFIKNLGRSDRLVKWHKTDVQPEWLTNIQWKSMPDRMTVREITLNVKISGFRSKTIIIATTLTDPNAFPKQAFAELYLRRWMVELYLRDIKISMGMDVLRCKTPKMIEKELWMHVIAYNLIRAIMQEAANSHRLSCECLSFKGTLSTVRQWAPMLEHKTLTQNGSAT